MFKLISLADAHFKIKHSIIVVTVICLSVLGTSLFFRSQFRYLKERNGFLEQRYTTSLAQPKIQPTKTPDNPNERKLESQEGNLLHVLYFNPDDYGADIETYDLSKDRALVTKHADDPYYNLVEKLANFNLSKIMLKTIADTQYAIFEVAYGYDAYQIFVASMDKNQEFKIDSFELATGGKELTLCAQHYLDYYPNTQQILVDYGCGDGCGGGGTIKLLSKNGSSTNLEEHGSGCGIQNQSEDQFFMPSYLTYLNGKLYFAEYIKAEQPKDPYNLWMDAVINKIYYIDPLTKSKKYLEINLAEQNLTTTWIDGVNLGTNEILLVKQQESMEEFYAFDVKTLQLRQYTGSTSY